MQELNLDKMPDSAFAKKEEKDYNVTITECKLVTATTGTKMIQCTYTTDEGIKVNFDNCPVYDSTGATITFGLAKLKKILTATDVKPVGNFQPSILPPLLIGKKFRVKLELDDKGKYLVIKNIDTIKPVENTNEDPFNNLTMQTEDNPWG